MFQRNLHDPALPSRARDQAHWLIRDHGDEAEAVLAAKMRRADLSPEDRKRYRLTRRALTRLRRWERQRDGDGLLARLLGLAKWPRRARGDIR